MVGQTAGGTAMKYMGTVYKTPQVNCKDCTDRHPACHDTCPAYQEAIATWKEQKRAIKQNKRAYKQVISHEIETTLHALRKNRR